MSISHDSHSDFRRYKSLKFGDNATVTGN
jgi:hypothetical protein